MEIKARRWLAVWYKCPKCGASHGSTMMTPTKRHRDYVPTCFDCKCKVEIMERRYYTTFAHDMMSVAGTLGEFGPFRVCNYVYPSIRIFRRVVAEREAELAEQSRKYMEEFNKRQAEGEARRKREEQELELIIEAERVVYRREHAVELLAEEVARAVWPEEETSSSRQLNPDDDYYLDDLPDHPF